MTVICSDRILVKLFEIARYHASALKQMGPVLFWVVTQQIVVISHQCNRPTYRPYLQGSRIWISWPL